jgi:hypothetical protein
MVSPRHKRVLWSREIKDIAKARKDAHIVDIDSFSLFGFKENPLVNQRVLIQLPINS